MAKGKMRGSTAHPLLSNENKDSQANPPRQDGNEGLIKQVVRHLPRFWVSDLQKTYAAVPIQQVATWLDQPAPGTEAYIRSLIADGLLNASIHAGKDNQPVLRFHQGDSTGPLAVSETERHAALVAQTERTNKLAEEVRAADQRLLLSKEYIEHLQKQKLRQTSSGMGKAAGSMGAAGTGGGDMMMDMAWDQDEDMMADMR